MSEPRKCKDGGDCHHGCSDFYCFREKFAFPLEGSGLGRDWLRTPDFTAVRTARTDKELLDAIERVWETGEHPVLRQLSLAVQEARAPRQEALAEFRRLGEALDQAKANGQAMVGLDLLRQRVHLHKVWAFTKEELDLPTTPPRYDEVWGEGTAVLDQIAQAGYLPTKHTIQFVGEGEDGATVQVLDLDILKG